MSEKSLKPMTIEEFDRLPEDNTKTYELIDGDLIMHARPNKEHQNIMLNVSREISNYLRSKNKPCKVFTEVEIEIDKNVIVPDITVICNLKNLDGQRFKEVPTLVIDILSPSNSAMEISSKVNKYRNHGIKECWIINPKLKSIEVKNLEDGISRTFIISGTASSNEFQDLDIRFEDIFD